jgi:hypothetical protein
MWPVQMSYWGNQHYGDCVTAEEAFAKAAVAPSIVPGVWAGVFIPQDTVLSWASANHYMNGTTLSGVLQKMQTGGIPRNNQQYNDGPYNTVDWSNFATLQSAIYNYGPVKIGVAAENFEGGGGVVGRVTGGTSGWTMYNYPKTTPGDHCVSLCGYAGSLSEMASLFLLYGVTVEQPEGFPAGPCYALFSWNSIGIIDQQSMLNMTEEAWVRKPVTEVVDSLSMPYLIYQDNATGAWSWYGQLPNTSPPVAFSQIATGMGNSGDLLVIGLGADDDNDGWPYLIYQSNGGWQWWGQLPNASPPVAFFQIATGVGSGGNLQEIGLSAPDGLPYLIGQDNATELPNASPPVRFSQIATGVGSGGNLQVIGLSGDQPYLIGQDNATGAWSWYGQLPNASPPVRFSQIATGVGSGGNLQVICLSGGQPYLICQDNATGAWSWYGQLLNAPVGFSKIATGVGSGDDLLVIGLSDDGLPYLIYQDNATGAWNWYGQLPNASPLVRFSQIATGVGSGGNLQVIGLGASNGLPYLICQDNAPGAWNWFGQLPNASSPIPFSQIVTGVGSGGNLQVIGLG